MKGGPQRVMLIRKNDENRNFHGVDWREQEIPQGYGEIKGASDGRKRWQIESNRTTPGGKPPAHRLWK